MSYDTVKANAPDPGTVEDAIDDVDCVFCQAHEDEPHEEACPMYVPECVICSSEQIDPEAVDGPLCRQCRVNCAMESGS